MWRAFDSGLALRSGWGLRLDRCGATTLPSSGWVARSGCAGDAAGRRSGPGASEPPGSETAVRWLLVVVDGVIASRRALSRRRRQIPAGSIAAASCSTSSTSMASRCHAMSGVSLAWARASIRMRSSQAILCSSRRWRQGASHVGIAIGGDQFVHAPSSRGVVRVERLSAEYWADRFVGARRVN